MLDLLLAKKNDKKTCVYSTIKQTRDAGFYLFETVQILKLEILI